MKKFFLILFLITGCTSVFPQSKIQFELSTGITLSVPKTSYLIKERVAGEPVVESSMNIGAFVLPGLNYKFNDKNSLGFGLGFSLDRFSITQDISFTRYKGNRNVFSIQIPVNYNFHFGKRKTYLIGVGVFASVFLSAKGTGNVSMREGDFGFVGGDPSFMLPRKYERDVKEFLNTFSMGMFIQLKKYLSFSSKLDGFVFIKINQYLNAMNEPNDSNLIFSLGNEKEPTMVNLGIGIKL